jgi:murein DD-endopeptidase MepM/ murein hydrolase activator NlpD
VARKTPGNRFFTLLVVPHEGKAQMRKVRIRKAFVYSAAGVIGLFALLGVLFPTYYLRVSAQHRALDRLTKENHELRQSQTQFEERIAGVRKQVKEFEGQARKFALMAGIEDLPEGDLAAGSPGLTRSGRNTAPLKDIEGELSVLGSQAQALLENYQMIGEAMDAQTSQLSSTPSIIPVRGLLGHGYGWRKDPFTGLRDFHPGIDIVANRGNRVHAPADGIVTKTGRSGGYGKVVFLSHGQGITTRYGHLDAIDVKVGQKVKRGDVVGRVGSTGRSTGPHLHYEVLVHNQKVNPVHYIIDEYRRF